MPLCARAGLVLGRCWQHQSSAEPILTHTGMFTGTSYAVLFSCFFMYGRTLRAMCYMYIALLVAIVLCMLGIYFQ